MARLEASRLFLLDAKAMRFLRRAGRGDDGSSTNQEEGPGGVFPDPGPQSR